MEVAVRSVHALRAAAPFGGQTLLNTLLRIRSISILIRGINILCVEYPWPGWTVLFISICL